VLAEHAVCSGLLLEARFGAQAKFALWVSPYKACKAKSGTYMRRYFCGFLSKSGCFKIAISYPEMTCTLSPPPSPCFFALRYARYENLLRNQYFYERILASKT
jgi:hypothetical protein